MADVLRHWWEGEMRPTIKVCGFAPAMPTVAPETPPCRDFLYVADGQAHKNHRCLLAAWVLLAEQGIRPSLGLTLSDRDEGLAREASTLAQAHGLSLEMLPSMDHAAVMRAYAESKALVYPSLWESYGLPLIEAAALGIPIVAAERDYVREVCAPVQTFDPESPRSIAHAVKRHLGLAPTPVAPVSSMEFWQAFGL